jgi:hypothetical protein
LLGCCVDIGPYAYAHADGLRLRESAHGEQTREQCAERDTVLVVHLHV